MRPQFCCRSGSLASAAVALDSREDGVQQILIPKWLGEEIDGAGLHRLYRHRDIAMPGHEDDRNLDIGLGEFALDIEAAQARQPNVEDEAGWNIRELFLQQLRRRT